MGVRIRRTSIVIFGLLALAAGALFFLISIDPDIYSPGAGHVHIGFGLGIDRGLPQRVQEDLTPRRILRKLYSVVAFAIIGFLAAPLLGARLRTARGPWLMAGAVAIFSGLIEIAQRAVDASGESFASNIFDVACGALGGLIGGYGFSRVARFLVLACLITLAFPYASVRAATTSGEIHIAGKLLDGTPATVPDAAAGKPCIVVVGMTRKSADATQRWSTELAKREGDHAAVYSIALLDSVPGLFRGMVVRSLRKQLDGPDGKAPAYFLTAFDGTVLRQIAPAGNDDDPPVYVFDGHGKLAASFRAPFSQDALDAVLKAVPTQ